ncbi:uncharacterized protein [Medicago truncatula]|uniref:uncharacterized protein n=1 Tax=Medicago truncatula TaxID=3880 RepID=UPI001967542F|nr:uncharacterized protein LOC120575792 [Medicago truncatula]
MVNHEVMILGSSSMTKLRACEGKRNDDELDNEDMYEEDDDYIASEEEDGDDSYFDDSGVDECVDLSMPNHWILLQLQRIFKKSTMKILMIYILPESEDEELGKNYLIFKMGDGNAHVKLEKGLKFNNKKQAKDAIEKYALETRKNLCLKKNKKEYLVVKCMPDYPFHLRISKRSANDFWQYTPAFSLMKVKALKRLAAEQWSVKLSHDQVYRSKLRALEIIQGAGRDQFLYLRSYAEELRRSNPNSTVIIKCDMADVGPIFQRIYVCPEACKAAFAYTCRPLIGLYACFLKGEHGGQLMAVVGKDANNQMFPIAYAVVEAETKDSWEWFLNLLLEDLQTIQHKQYAFISDKQKGLVPAIQNLGSHVEHRLCVKHLYANFKKRYPGLDLKEVFWMAGRATTVPVWERAMNQMKLINDKAWEYMNKNWAPAMWTRSHFKMDTQSDLQVNNICEAFNRPIL